MEIKVGILDKLYIKFIYIFHIEISEATKDFGFEGPSFAFPDMEDAFDMANLENFFNENFFKKTRPTIENNFEKDQFGGVPESHYEPTFKSVSSSSVRPNLESKGFGSDSWTDSELSSPVQLNFETKNFGSDSWSDSELSAPVQPNFESKNFDTDSWSDYEQRSNFESKNFDTDSWSDSEQQQSNFESKNFGSDSWGDTELPIGPSLESLKEFENLKSRKFVSDSWDDSKIGRTGQQIMERRYDKIDYGAVFISNL